MITRENKLNNLTTAFNKADWQSNYDDNFYCDDDDDEDWEDETENCQPVLFFFLKLTLNKKYDIIYV